MVDSNFLEEVLKIKNLNVKKITKNNLRQMKKWQNIT